LIALRAQHDLRRVVSATIIRHPKERLSKCSLRPLEGRPELTFFRAGGEFRFDAAGFLLLDLDAPPLAPRDAGPPLLLLDSTWRLVPRLRACLDGAPIRRSLPPVATAYPRQSKVGADPRGGLASVEALYLARRVLGDRDDSLLRDYRWRDAFLRHVTEAGIA